jgi:hypothetical protein
MDGFVKGDARGPDTLVVETTNFTSKTRATKGIRPLVRR